MAMVNEEKVEISLPNKIGYERLAMECSASFARMFGFTKERIEDIKTAVSEACLNAIEHGNEGHPDARVIVTINSRNGAIVVSVTDEGAGIPEFPSEPSIEKKIEGQETPRGLGIFLIRHLVDDLEFVSQAQGGHEVRMVFKESNEGKEGQ